jgi:hypothetical protein
MSCPTIYIDTVKRGALIFRTGNSMNIHSFISTSTLTALVLSSNSYAQEVEGNSQFFTKMYAGFCMKNINDFEALRTKLVNSKLPKFPPDQAKNFLHGKVGDAWPVPHQGQMGNFVLALPIGFCTLQVRRANQADIERQFIQLVGSAPAPLIAKKTVDNWNETGANGKTHTISYTWSSPKAMRKMQFTLTTASSENAELQVFASTAMVKE